MDVVALGAAADTVTVAVCETVTPLMVAVIVLLPAPVDCSVAVVVPFASVTAGVETVLPLPLTESVTAAPLTRPPEASFATTVIVLAPLPAVKPVGAADTVDWLALTGAALTAMAPEVAAESPPEKNTSVRVPALPAMERSVNVA